jgi:hypothetical protein
MEVIMARNERPSGRTIDPSSDEEIRQVGYIPDDRESEEGDLQPQAQQSDDPDRQRDCSEWWDGDEEPKF